MKIYNTLSGKKEEFVPADSGKVKMYVCGPTVYSYIHIGNARTFVFFDTARRYLMHKGYDVNYVQNYTDIDDKIIKTANAENISVNDVAKRYIAEAEKDFEGFSILKPTNSPRVTQEMPEIIKMISDLISGGYAYEKNGSVFYDTGAFSGYGKLSKKHIDELNAGARIEINDEKKNPMDFVLWKPAKEGEPSWESPWGAGRPGWHIECSVMAKKYLGETIDIHAGGEDL
ncbi:MAG: cysteine--tRNA ligase, partial [Clostridiales bacterium]|nr:cysteine--tRNA ligase [Clostridiales bacterium]